MCLKEFWSLQSLPINFGLSKLLRHSIRAAGLPSCKAKWPQVLNVTQYKLSTYITQKFVTRAVECENMECCYTLEKMNIANVFKKIWISLTIIN
jgi:hypothetical protein